MATNDGIKETGEKKWQMKITKILHLRTNSPAPHTDTETETEASKYGTGTKIPLIEMDKIALTRDGSFYPLKPTKLRKVGKGIIIVNESFENHDEQLRAGAEKDREHFEAIFDKLGIDYRNRVFFNLATGDMLKELTKFANMEVPEESVFFVAIATYSEQMGEITGTDNAVISLEHIYNFFNENLNLLNIPKVFLIVNSKVIPKSELQADMIPPTIIDCFKSKSFHSATAISDTLIVQSSLESRNEERGSFFIQELLKSIYNPEYDNLHFVEILTLCNGSIMDEFPDCAISIHSTLRMKLRF